jgi:hypothetical protein
MIHLVAEGQGKHEALGGGKEWAIRDPLVASSEQQTMVVRHVLGSRDFMISFKGPAGKTELLTEAVTAIESLSRKRELYAGLLNEVGGATGGVSASQDLLLKRRRETKAT